VERGSTNNDSEIVKQMWIFTAQRQKYIYLR